MATLVYMQPDFSRTWWFLGLCAGLLALVVLAVVVLRLRSIARAIEHRALQADERARSARHVHDTFLQGVQGLLLRFHAAAQAIPKDRRARAKLDEALESGDRILLEARDRDSRLRLGLTEGVDLVDGFEKIAASLDPDRTVAFSLVVEGHPAELRLRVREEAYFIGRKAMTHAFRQGKATTIVVRLSYAKVGLKLVVEDDGVALNPAAAGSHARRERFNDLRARSARAGGVLDCRVVPGMGTTLTFTVTARRAFRCPAF